MSPESVVLFQNAGSALIAVLFMVSLWIVVGPMLEGDKKKKRMESVATARESFTRLGLYPADRRDDGLGAIRLLSAQYLREKRCE